MFPSITKGMFRFILKVTETVVLSSIADIASWLFLLVVGFDDTTTYLFDSLCSGICVVLPTLPYPLSWLMTKTSLEVSIKTDFSSFLKLWSSNSCGRVICWLEGISTFLSIFAFNKMSRRKGCCNVHLNSHFRMLHRHFSLLILY